MQHRFPLTSILISSLCLVGAPSVVHGAPPTGQITVEPSATPRDAQFAELANATATLRDRNFTGPVDWTVTDTQTLVETVIMPEIDSEQLKEDERRLKKLGLLPEDLGLEEALLPLLTEQIVGVYVPRTEKMYAVEMAEYLAAAGLPGEAEEPLFDFTLVHELTHALQDQLFDLERFSDPEAIDRGEMTLDELAARLALIEGDAMFVSMDYLLSQTPGAGPGLLGKIPAQNLEVLLQSTVTMDVSGPSEMSTAPPFLRDALIAPYTYGMLFVHALFGNEAWNSVDAAYADRIPTSTEHILHPDRYMANDQPTTVPDFGLGEVLGEEWNRDAPSMLGELDIRLFARYHLGQEREVEISTGWDGDRTELFVNRAEPSIHLLVWASVWDTPEDATQFLEAYREWQVTRLGPQDVATETWPTAAGEVSIEQRGNWVVAIDALPEAKRLTVSKRVWEQIGHLLPRP